jgi:UDP-2,3-diacylglucosamine pyrophosphatase LpxH
MIFSFDLISDIHRETWTHFDWTGQPTAPYCIVAGDIARDRALVVDTLEQLSEVYQGVFYIDGNDEHKDYIEDLGQSYLELEALISQIPKVVYLQDNVVVINGVAILATNGWWTYDFDPLLEYDQSIQWVQEKDGSTLSAAQSIGGVGYHDAAYMVNSVSKLQKQKDVMAIVLVTHTVPSPWIINHDPELTDTWRFNSMGNRHMDSVFDEDTENKIKAWCFGHYHMPIDTIKDNCRYISNPRGRGNTPYSQAAYYPKRITIKY